MEPSSPLENDVREPDWEWLSSGCEGGKDVIQLPLNEPKNRSSLDFELIRLGQNRAEQKREGNGGPLS